MFTFGSAEVMLGKNKAKRGHQHSLTCTCTAANQPHNLWQAASLLLAFCLSHPSAACQFRLKPWWEERFSCSLVYRTLSKMGLQFVQIPGDTAIEITFRNDS